ncbi:hypothetical protein QQ045_023573 [Rhodiola kirilowii]
MKPSTRLEETASKPSQAAEPSVAVPVSDSEEESMVLRSGELATNPSWFTPKRYLFYDLDYKIDSSFRTRSLAFVKGLTISHSMLLPVYPAGAGAMEFIMCHAEHLLKEAHDALSGEYDGRVSQPVDIEVGSQKLRLNKRTKLQKYVGFAATLVESLKFQRLGSQRIASSDLSTCLQLVVSIHQMMQLQLQQQQQQQVITGLMQALLKANSSQLRRHEEDEDIESSD